MLHTALLSATDSLFPLYLLNHKDWVQSYLLILQYGTVRKLSLTLTSTQMGYFLGWTSIVVQTTVTDLLNLNLKFVTFKIF